MTDQFRIIGQLEAQMDAHSERLDRIETKLDVLTEYIQQQKGGMRLIWAIAGAGGVIGFFVVKLGGLVLSSFKGPP
jgi:tetrahydromethanopterin S-methyltransferase subunit G